MGRKRSTTVERDRLRSIVLSLVNDDDLDLNVSVFAEKIGFVSDKERRSAAQAISRWLYGRRADEESGETKEDLLPRPLKRTYRAAVFKYVRDNSYEEYRKPLPPGEVWPNAEERERWLHDSREGRVERRDPALLDGFVAYLRSGATITQATKDFARAEMDSALGESGSKEYGPAGGIVEEDYRRLAEVGDPTEDTLDDLAWAVVSNLLWKKGLLRSQIGRARRLIKETGAIRDRVDAASFKAVADSLYDEVTRRG